MRIEYLCNYIPETKFIYRLRWRRHINLALNQIKLRRYNPAYANYLKGARREFQLGAPKALSLSLSLSFFLLCARARMSQNYTILLNGRIARCRSIHDEYLIPFRNGIPTYSAKLTTRIRL